MTTYAEAWPIYRALGWAGTLPLRAGTKNPPPIGWTGWDGRYPSGADCAEWAEMTTYRGTSQLALRMGSIVIGTDFDAYSDKTGAETATEAARRWGRLPEGPWSSARDDGVSGIRFFRVPDGTVLVSNLAFPELRIGHVEIIQRHHRFAVVWPSRHPATGTQYTWRGTADPDQPPAVDDLPELPEAWLAALAGTGQQGERARPEQVDSFLASLPVGTACPAVLAALREADASLHESHRSRHDNTRDHVLRILRLGEQGHPGAVTALSALQVRFCRIVTADESRTYAAAVSEFDRMVDGLNGIGLLAATPTPDERRGCRCRADTEPPSRAAIVGVLRKVLNADTAERPRLLAWATRKLRAWAKAGQLDPVYVSNVVEQLEQAVGGSR